MKRHYILHLIALFCVLNAGYGQLLTVIEKNKSRIDTVKVNSAQIIDINGNLEIGISKKALIEQLRISHPEYGTQLDLQEHIDALDKALTNQENLLARLKQQTLNTADKQEFYAQLNAFYLNLLADGNEALRAEANSLFEEWRQLYGPRSSNPNSGIKKEVYILTNFNNSLDAVKQDLANMNGKSFMVSMIAYVYSDLGKNRVHVENFDTIAESEIYTVPRWVTTVSPEQATQLHALQKRAVEYNQEAFNYFERFKAEILSKLPDLSCIKSLKTEIEIFINNENVATNIKSALKSDAASLVAEIEGLDESINLVAQDISKWTLDTPFEIIANAKNLSNSVQRILNNFEGFKNTSEAFTSETEKVKTLITSFDSCYSSISADVNGLISALSILRNQQDRYNDNDAIGDEVTKFTVNDLPSSGFIKLERSGTRGNGDELEVILVLRIPETSTPETTTTPTAYKNEKLESRLLTMQLIGARSEVAVGMIMANPNGSSVDFDLERKFYFAPSASLLVKFGSRKSHFYNEFIDFGVGLNFASPDFNTDGSPEFGTGLIVTAFRDILSVGYNYNVTLDTPYWFFGVNLPFNLSGLPVNTVR